MIEEILVDEENDIEESDESMEDCIQNEVLAKKESKTDIKFGDIKFGKKIKVYAKIDSEGFVTDLNSDVFLKDLTGWTQIDEGYGDKYLYPQTEYFDAPIVDEDGNYRFKIEK